MVSVSVELDDIKQFNNNVDNFIDEFISKSKASLDKAVKNVAQDIQVIFKGRPGFNDRTGALRASIKGGISDELSSGKEIVAFFGAGDDSVGSDGKQTKDYVNFVEFPELRGRIRNKNTAFLRPSMMMARNQIKDILTEELDVDRII